jgi:hypothetical protein
MRIIEASVTRSPFVGRVPEPFVAGTTISQNSYKDKRANYADPACDRNSLSYGPLAFEKKKRQTEWKADHTGQKQK